MKTITKLKLITTLSVCAAISFWPSASHAEILLIGKPEQVKPSFIIKPIVASTPTPISTSTVTPTIQPTPYIASSNTPSWTPPSQSDVVSYINEVFGPNAPVARCIASHESSFTWNAKHQNIGSMDYGVFQINDYWWPQFTPPNVDLEDWKENIEAAYQISNSGTDWSDWATKYYCI